MNDMFEGLDRPRDICRAEQMRNLVRKRTDRMKSRVTENKPAFRSEVSRGENRAYEDQPTLQDGRNRIPVNIKFSQRNTEIVRGLKIIER